MECASAPADDTHPPTWTWNCWANDSWIFWENPKPHPIPIHPPPRYFRRKGGTRRAAEARSAPDNIATVALLVNQSALPPPPSLTNHHLLSSQPSLSLATRIQFPFALTLPDLHFPYLVPPFQDLDYNLSFDTLHPLLQCLRTSLECYHELDLSFIPLSSILLRHTPTYTVS